MHENADVQRFFEYNTSKTSCLETCQTNCSFRHTMLQTKRKYVTVFNPSMWDPDPSLGSLHWLLVQFILKRRCQQGLSSTASFCTYCRSMYHEVVSLTRTLICVFVFVFLLVKRQWWLVSNHVWKRRRHFASSKNCPSRQIRHLHEFGCRSWYRSTLIAI